MSTINLFLDSSALFAGVVSASGAARALLMLAETGQLTVTISEQVVTETERAVARKAPRALQDLRETIFVSQAQIVRDPAPEVVKEHMQLIAHPADVPIVLAALEARVDFLVTLNRKHFIDDPGVSQKSGLRIGTPGDALAWVRAVIAAEDD